MVTGDGFNLNLDSQKNCLNQRHLYVTLFWFVIETRQFPNLLYIVLSIFQRSKYSSDPRGQGLYVLVNKSQLGLTSSKVLITWKEDTGLVLHTDINYIFP